MLDTDTCPTRVGHILIVSDIESTLTRVRHDHIVSWTWLEHEKGSSVPHIGSWAYWMWLNSSRFHIINPNQTLKLTPKSRGRSLSLLDISPKSLSRESRGGDLLIVDRRQRWSLSVVISSHRRWLLCWSSLVVVVVGWSRWAVIK